MDNNLYRIIPEAGKHLAESHDTEGAYRGVYLDNETNKPCGACELEKVNLDELLNNGTVDEDSAGDNADAIGLLGGLAAFIGVYVIKVTYPHVKKWVTDTAMPETKRWWRKIHSKENEVQQTQISTKNIKPETDESMSLSLETALHEYRENISNEKAQKELIDAFIYIIQGVMKIQRVAKSNVVDSAGKITDGRLMIQESINENILESINSILQEKPALLEEQQRATLSEVLGYNIFDEQRYVSITAQAISDGMEKHFHGPIALN